MLQVLQGYSGDDEVMWGKIKWRIGYGVGLENNQKT